MTDKLKPCPHCGREAMMIKTQKCGRYVMCMWCESRTRECEADYLESAYDKSANAWNRRAEPATDHSGDTNKTINDPLTLDELREVKVGAPLWMEYEDGAYGEWGLVCRNRDSFTVVGLHEHHKPDDYGKTWLAYRQKPEEETK